MRSGDYSHMHIRQIKRATVGPAQLGGGSDHIAIGAHHLEMIVKVRECPFQAGAHAKPGFGIERFRDGTAEAKTLCEHGPGGGKITLLDRIHEGPDGFSFIHNVFLTTTYTVSEQMVLGRNGCSLWNIL